MMNLLNKIKVSKEKINVSERISDFFSNLSMKKDDAVFWCSEFFKTFKAHWKKFLIGVFIIPLLLWAFIAWALATDEIVTVTGKETKVTDVVIVTKKDSKTGKTVDVPKNVDTYFVYTDKGAFQYRTSWLYLQIEVADSFGRLQEGKTYKFTHYGFRNSLFDWYENIIGFEEIKNPVGSVEESLERDAENNKPKESNKQ